MASVSQVRSYLAYWFQLGKPIVFDNHHSQCLPYPIFQGSRFSVAFEQCWQRILATPKDCHLSGTAEAIASLLSDEWDIVECARCPMPRPIRVHGIADTPCPCHDLPSWPNADVPMPRLVVSSRDHLGSICDRLNEATSRERLQSVYASSPNLPAHKVRESPIERRPMPQAPDAR